MKFVNALGDLLIVVSTIAVVGLAFLGLCHLGIFCLVRRMEDRPAPDIKSLFGDDVARHDRLLVYFFSDRCPACRTVTPVVESLAKTHDNVLKINTGAHAEAAHQFAIIGTPTVVLVDHNRIAKVLVGASSEKRIRALLEPAA
jgi:thioredoxin 1